MPLLCCTSRVKAVDDTTSLALSARHCYLYGDDSRSDLPASKTRLPDNVDVLVASTLVFTLTGSLDGEKISKYTILRSQLACHFSDYLKANAAALGLTNVSIPHMEDDSPSVAVNVARCMPQTKRTHVVLTAINLNYDWTTETTSRPFARRLSLPFIALLDNVLDRFTSSHLLKRYPLAFGTWCQQLDVELSFAQKILRSISAMVKRSPNPDFRSSCKRYLKTIKRSQESVIASSEASMSAWLENVSNSKPSKATLQSELSLEEAFSMTLEGCYRRMMRQPRFKSQHLMSSGSADAGDDDDLIAQTPTRLDTDSLLNGLDSQLASKRYLQTHDIFSPFDFELPTLPSTMARVSSSGAQSLDDNFFEPDLDKAQMDISLSLRAKNDDIYEEASDLCDTMDALQEVKSDASIASELSDFEAFATRLCPTAWLQSLAAAKHRDVSSDDESPPSRPNILTALTTIAAEPAMTMDSDSGTESDTGVRAVRCSQDPRASYSQGQDQDMSMDMDSDSDESLDRVPALVCPDSASHSQSSDYPLTPPMPLFLHSDFEPSIDDTANVESPREEPRTDTEHAKADMFSEFDIVDCYTEIKPMDWDWDGDEDMADFLDNDLEEDDRDFRGADDGGIDFPDIGFEGSSTVAPHACDPDAMQWDDA